MYSCKQWTTFIAVVVLTGISPARSSEFSAAQVRKIWEQRAKKLSPVDMTIQTSHFETTTEEYIKRYSGGEASPPISYQTTARLAVSGEMTRFEVCGARPNDNRELREQNFVSSYDNEMSCLLFEPDTNKSYPAGFIYTESHCSNATPLENYPLLFVCSPHLLPLLGVDLDTMTIQVEEAKISGFTCIVLQQPEQPSQLACELWLDPQSEYSVRRARFLSGSRCVAQIDCDYSPVSDHWFPGQWTSMKFFPDGSLLTSATSTISEILPNKNLTRDDFSITFPVGTVVSDLRNPETAGRTGTHDYIVLENGKKREITWEERHLTYEQLLSKTPQNNGQPRGLFPLLVGVNIIILLLLAVYVIVVRRRM